MPNSLHETLYFLLTMGKAHALSFGEVFELLNLRLHRPFLSRVSRTIDTLVIYFSLRASPCKNTLHRLR